VLALAIGELDLQDDVARRDGERGERVLEGPFELELPALRTLVEERRQAREPFAPGLRLLEPG
jgi:hypothetical protein